MMPERRIAGRDLSPLQPETAESARREARKVGKLVTRAAITQLRDQNPELHWNEEWIRKGPVLIRAWEDPVLVETKKALILEKTEKEPQHQFVFCPSCEDWVKEDPLSENCLSERSYQGVKGLMIICEVCLAPLGFIPIDDGKAQKVP